MDIQKWVNRIIKGASGFEVWEDREAVIFNNSREEGIAEFVLNCLANPKCEGSADILQAILELRAKKEKQLT
jgi:hypothetical protein